MGKKIFFLFSGCVLFFGVLASGLVDQLIARTTPALPVLKAPFEILTENARVPVPEGNRNRNKEIFHVTPFKADQISSGLNLVPVSGTEQVLLVSNSGDIVHRWNFDAVRARLLKNCNLLVLHGSKTGKERLPWAELKDRVREYTWDGQVAWSAKTTEGIFHHDVQRTERDSTLLLRRFEMVAGNPRVQPRPGRPPYRLLTDQILEINQTGEILWQWNAHEHFSYDYCGWRGCQTDWPVPQKKHKFRDWTHINTVSPLPENKWHRKGDSRFRPGNLLIIPRNFWTAYLIDKKSGKIVWEYEGEHGGNVSNVQDGLIRGHEAHMIPEGFPGAGNILIYDNGFQKYRPFSIIREISPVTKEVVWEYRNEGGFFSYGAGAVQRLKNGNTLISVDRGNGQVFEVNPEGELVWSMNFRNRFLPIRARRYPPEHCEMLSKNSM